MQMKSLIFIFFPPLFSTLGFPEARNIGNLAKRKAWKERVGVGAG